MLQNERGSVTIVAILVLLAVVAGTLIITDFFSVYVTKRQSQNVADSAVLAATQVLKEKYEEEMSRQADHQLQQFWQDLDQDILSCAAAGVGPCLSKDELVKDRISNHELENLLLQYLLNPATKIDWHLVVKEPYFIAKEFNARHNGDILYDVCRREAGTIHYAAEDLAGRNSGSNQLTITFPVDNEPKLLLKGYKTIRIDQIVQYQDDVASTSAAGLKTDFDIDVSGKVPFDF